MLAGCNFMGEDITLKSSFHPVVYEPSAMIVERLEISKNDESHSYLEETYPYQWISSINRESLHSRYSSIGSFSEYKWLSWRDESTHVLVCDISHRISWYSIIAVLMFFIIKITWSPASVQEWFERVLEKPEVRRGWKDEIVLLTFPAPVFVLHEFKNT